MFAIWLAEAKPLWMEGAFFVFLFKLLQILLDYDLFILNLLFFLNFITFVGYMHCKMFYSYYA